MTEPRKPSNLLYGLNDHPPLGITMALGLQHVFYSFYLAHLPGDNRAPVLGTGIDAYSANKLFVSLSTIAGGVLDLFFAGRPDKTFWFGISLSCAMRAFVPFGFNTSAVTTGGLPLLFGMTAFAGAVEVAFSRVMNRLRFLFTAEVMGIIVALIGIVIIPVAIKNFLVLAARIP